LFGSSPPANGRVENGSEGWCCGFATFTNGAHRLTAYKIPAPVVAAINIKSKTVQVVKDKPRHCHGRFSGRFPDEAGGFGSRYKS
jgi:hypothetical protein